jgi:hypothetical protein
VRALVFVLDVIVCAAVFSVSAVIVLRLRPGVRILTRWEAPLFARQRLWRDVSATDIWLYALGFAWSTVTVPAQAVAYGLNVGGAGSIGLITTIGLIVTVLVVLIKEYVRLSHTPGGLFRASPRTFLVVAGWLVVGFTSTAIAISTNYGRG